MIDGPLYADRSGPVGRPMVFLHPNPTDRRIWLYQAARFSTWFQVINVDLPGYGHSPTAGAGLSMADVAAAAWALVDAVSDEPAIIAGCSVGYAAAMHMSLLRPDRVAALLLSGASYRPVKTSAPRRIAQYQAEGLGARRRHFDEVVGSDFRGSPLHDYLGTMFLESNAHADLDTILELYRAVGAPDEDRLFSSVTAPTLIITGSEDGAHQNAFPLRDRIPGARLVTMEGAGHACQVERPWEWDAHAIDFLREHGLLDPA